MEKTALLIEFQEGRFKPANLGMAALVRRSGATVSALVIDAADAAVDEAREVLQAHGIGEIIAVRTASAHAGNPACRSQAVVAAMMHFGIRSLIGLTTPYGRDLLPRIAARLDAPLVMDCIDIDIAGRRARAAQFSGKAIATIELSGTHFIYGLRPNAVAPQPCPAAAALIDIVAFSAAPGPDDTFQLLDSKPGTGDFQNLAEAEVILSGGRGMKNGENFKLLAACARLIDNAAVGASRVAVDAGWVPYRMQVGQTGAKVNPKVYMAFGISGSIQHFAGMKSSGLIIAVNTDPQAAILSRCDYYAVADLFEVLPALARALAGIKSGNKLHS